MSFSIGGLLARLVYQCYGPAAILAFIGVKLVLNALRDNTLQFIKSGQHNTSPNSLPRYRSRSSAPFLP